MVWSNEASSVPVGRLNLDWTVGAQFPFSFVELDWLWVERCNHSSCSGKTRLQREWASAQALSLELNVIVFIVCMQRAVSNLSSFKGARALTPTPEEWESHIFTHREENAMRGATQGSF